MTPEEALAPADAGFGFGLSVDVEEWYHTCLVPEYVHPERRPAGLAEELDWLLPELLALLSAAGRRATFFVLGEVARRWSGRVREIAAAGHEVASHADLHLRANELPVAEFSRQVRGAKHLLEDLIGREVIGFRAPEWSLRSPANPRLAVLAELGFRYDSSLSPALGAGRLTNRRTPYRLELGDRTLYELPPLVWGGALRLPVGGWTGRRLAAARVREVALRTQRRGGLPLLVVHPWEISGRPTPGRLGGLARFIHESGRLAFRARFECLLALLPWERIDAAASALLLSP